MFIKRVIVPLFVAGLLAAAHGAPAFPVRYSANNHYLVDQNGAPFPIMGRTAWFVLSLSVADYRLFIDDTASRGYSAIELHVINHDPRGNNPPFNGNGDAPFLKRLDGTAWDGVLCCSAPDFTTPNEAYWNFVDAFLSYCESKGILVFLFPAYVGFQGGDQGWMKEIVANGDTKMRSYGAWIATRYKNQKNLVWMMGGDMGTPPYSFNAAQTSVENALLTGLKSVTGQRSTLFSAEWVRGSIATDQTTFGGAMTLNGVYSSSDDVNTLGRRAYAFSPGQPAYLLEEPYDQEGADGNGVNLNATQPVRRFQWWGWLSAIGGYISGNGYVWPFRAPAWRDHLNTQGSRDMARLNAFMSSIAWYKLVPSGLSGMKAIITAGGSSANLDDYVAAAAAPDGSLMVAYIPPDHSGSITVDMSVMRGPVKARWFDPTSGAYTSIASALPNTGSREFTPPSNNSAGDGDWVLVMDTQPGMTAAPGTYSGLFYEEDEVRQQSAGFLSVSVTSAGKYSGRLQIGNKRHGFSGKLDFQGHATNVIVRRGTSRLALDLSVGTGGESDQIFGYVTNEDWVATLRGNRSVFNSKTNPPPYTNKFTMIVPGQEGDHLIPVGDSFGTVRLSTRGTVSFVGTLADNTRVSQSAPLSKEGMWPLYVSLYSGNGSILSWIAFTNQASRDFSGALSWIKLSNAKARYYAHGFTNDCDAIGSAYVTPVGSNILNLTNAHLEFNGGNLSSSITNFVILGANSRVMNASSNRLTMSFSLTVGTFRGSVTDPASRKALSFSGVVLQKLGAGYGFLLGTNQSSQVVFGQ